MRPFLHRVTRDHQPDAELADLARRLDHDIRSPLTSLCTHADCLRLVTEVPEDRRDLQLRTISAQARRAARLCGYYCTLVTPPPDEPARDVELRPLLNEVLLELADLMESSGIAAGGSVAEGTLHWPPEALRQLLFAAIETMLSRILEGATLTVRLAVQRTRAALLEVDASLLRPTPQKDPLAYLALVHLLEMYGGRLSAAGDRAAGLAITLPPLEAHWRRHAA